jgi:hypothetical protein
MRVILRTEPIWAQCFCFTVETLPVLITMLREGTGPGTTVTCGKAITDEVDAMGFKWEWNGKSSKLISFAWSGP